MNQKKKIAVLYLVITLCSVMAEILKSGLRMGMIEYQVEQIIAPIILSVIITIIFLKSKKAGFFYVMVLITAYKFTHLIINKLVLRMSPLRYNDVDMLECIIIALLTLFIKWMIFDYEKRAVTVRKFWWVPGVIGLVTLGINGVPVNSTTPIIVSLCINILWIFFYFIFAKYISKLEETTTVENEKVRGFKSKIVVITCLAIMAAGIVSVVNVQKINNSMNSSSSDVVKSDNSSSSNDTYDSDEEDNDLDNDDTYDNDSYSYDSDDSDSDDDYSEDKCSICGGTMTCNVCGASGSYCYNASFGTGRRHYCGTHWADLSEDSLYDEENDIYYDYDLYDPDTGYDYQFQNDYDADDDYDYDSYDYDSYDYDSDDYDSYDTYDYDSYDFDY